ncbi:hypothetical protein AAG906_007498 [Vitis piasezkii]
MNFIQGEIPIELTNCSRLRTVDFTRNNLTGQIPCTLAICRTPTSMAWCQLFKRATDNHLSGNFMSNMRFSSQLRKFGIAMNQITGIIPDTLSNISGLELLDLGENYPTRKIPDSLGVLKDLRQSFWGCVTQLHCQSLNPTAATRPRRKQNIWKHPKRDWKPHQLDSIHCNSELSHWYHSHINWQASELRRIGLRLEQAIRSATVHPRQLKSTEREHSYISQELPQYGNSGPQSQQVEW